MPLFFVKRFVGEKKGKFGKSIEEIVEFINSEKKNVKKCLKMCISPKSMAKSNSECFRQ